MTEIFTVLPVSHHHKTKLAKENIFKMRHGPKMGQNKFECACVSGVFTFLFLSCFKAHTYSQWDMEVLACFRPSSSMFTKKIKKTARCAE